MTEVPKDWSRDFVAQQQMSQAQDARTYRQWEADKTKEPEETKVTEEGKEAKKSDEELATELVKHTEKLKEGKHLKELEEKQIQEEVKNKLLARLGEKNLRDMDIDPKILDELIDDVKSGTAFLYAEDPDTEADEIVKQLMSKPQDIKKLIKESNPGAEYKPEKEEGKV